MGRLARDKEHRLQQIQLAAAELSPLQFQDYKDYLQKLYANIKKAQKGPYSWVHFTEDLGLGSCNVAWLIANGKRKMTVHTLNMITNRLKLSGVKRKYLKILREYTNATTIKKREPLLDRLLQIKKESLPTSIQDQLDFFSKWYHAVIFELVGVDHFRSDPEWIANQLSPPISEAEAEASLELLVRLKCIKFDQETKSYSKIIQDFNTEDEIPWEGVECYHKSMIDLAKSAIDCVPPKNREISNTTMTLSLQEFNLIKSEIRKFRKQINTYTGKESASDVVVAVNMQFFPLTQLDIDKESESS